MQNIILVKLCIFESLWHFLFCHEGTKAHKVFIIFKTSNPYIKYRALLIDNLYSYYLKLNLNIIISNFH